MFKLIWLPLIGLLFLSGCPKKTEEARFKALEDRIAALEKIVLPPEKVEQKEAFKFPVDGSHVFGSPSTPISIMMFTNLQCKFCAEADAELRKLIETELKTEAHLVMKNFPFMERSKPAIKAAFAAAEQGEDHFWSFVTKAYANRSELTDANFVKWATELKLDVKKFESDLKDNDAKYEAVLAKEMELVNQAGVNYTPFILVNGWKYEGARTAAAIKEFAASKKK